MQIDDGLRLRLREELRLAKSEYQSNPRDLSFLGGLSPADMRAFFQGVESRSGNQSVFVSSARFSHEARRVFAGCEDGTLRIWDIATRRCLKVCDLKAEQNGVQIQNTDLRGHTKAITRVVLAGHQVLTASLDGSLQMWSSDGKWQGIVFQNDTAIRDVCISPNAQWIALIGEDGVVKVRETAPPAKVKLFPGHKGTGLAVAACTDNVHILSAAGDDGLRRWKLDAGMFGKKATPLPGHTGTIRAIVAASDRVHALSGGDDGTIRVWNVPSGECVRTFGGPPLRIEGLALFRTRPWVLVGGYHEIQIWDWKEGQLMKVVPIGPQSLESLDLSPQDRHILLGGLDLSIREI